MSVEIARARIGDVPAVAALVERYARRGEVLPRLPQDVYETVREWVVAKQEDGLVGCGSLVVLWADMAEIRSLVVTPELHGRGIGGQIVRRLLADAAALEIPQVIALTRRPDFFARLGFNKVARESLPRKIWKDCMHCTKFTGCDEVAMVMPTSSLKMDASGATSGAASACSSGDGQARDYMVLPHRSDSRR
jgi:amino-acid N-acetyltransferase